MDLKKYAPIAVRLGISLVFLWFGSQQIIHSSDWTGYLPSFTENLPVQATTLVLMNGIFEVIFGSLLILGIYTRAASLLLSLHLISIMLAVGYNEIGVRDFGLFMGALSVFLNGSDDWCLDRKLNLPFLRRY